MGLFTILNQQFRDKRTIFNMQTYYPTYDYRKRYIDLASTDFRVLIEFTGSKWVGRQNFEDLEKRVEDGQKFAEKFSENIAITDINSRINRALYILEPAGSLDESTLQANNLFETKEELKEYFENCLKLHQAGGNNNQIKQIVQTAFDSQLFEVERKTLFHLKVNRGNRLKFFNSLDRKGLYNSKQINKDVKAPRQTRKSASDNTVFEGEILTDNILSLVLKELETFEKAFFDLLVKLIDKFEKAKLYDNALDTSIGHNGKQPLQLTAAEKALLELLYIFYEMVDVYMLAPLCFGQTKLKTSMC